MPSIRRLSGSSSWATVLRHYDANGRQTANAELGWFRSQPSLEEAIRNAALALDERGKRYSHQRRIARASLEEGHRQLASRESALREISDFDALLRLVSNAVDEVRGLGELWRYDTALRIGARLGLEPQLVYLHAGTRVGAKRLGLDANAALLPMEAFPDELKPLPPREVEDILCIYKAKLPRA